MLRKFVIFLSCFFIVFPFLGECLVFASDTTNIDFTCSMKIGAKSDYDENVELHYTPLEFTLHYTEETVNLIKGSKIVSSYDGESNFSILTPCNGSDDDLFHQVLSEQGFVDVQVKIGFSPYVGNVKNYYSYYINGTLVCESRIGSLSFGSTYDYVFSIESSCGYDLSQFVFGTTLSSKDIENFNFTGYQFSPTNNNDSSNPFNGYGTDLTVYFNIACNYVGLDGFIFGKESMLKDEILSTLKESSVLTWNGKKLNIPTNKMSIHFYEPTNYSTDELTSLYGSYELSTEGPYSLYKNGDGRLRGTIIFFSGNLPQTSGDVVIEYKSNFVDTALNKYWSFKGYSFESHTYSCSQNIFQQGVVDSDSDGIDDNTGIHVGDKYDSNGNHTVYGTEVEDEPNRSDYDDGILGLVEYVGDLIVYWIKSPFIAIGNVFSTLINSANESLSWFGEFGEFFGSFFSFLPSPIQTCMFAIISATTISIILAMFLKR